MFYIRPVASHPGGGGGLNLDGWNTIQARIQDFLKGGHKHPPLGQCLRDVICPPKN